MDMLDKGHIDRFKSIFDSGARSNLFHVNILLPSILRNPNFDGSQNNLPLNPRLGFDMGMRVETCSLPSRKLETKDFSPNGPKQPHVTGLSQDTTVSMQFLCDSSFLDRYLIEAWQGLIYASPLSSNNEDRQFDPTSINPVFSYYDEYAKDSRIEIFSLRRDMKLNRPALKCTLYDAYPISYEAMELTRSDNSLLKFKCVFGFRTFSTEYTPPPEVSLLNRGRRFISAFADLAKVGSRYNSKSKEYLDRLSRLDETGTLLNDIFGG